jgi:hypothetical protein
MTLKTNLSDEITLAAPCFTLFHFLVVKSLRPFIRLFAVAHKDLGTFPDFYRPRGRCDFLPFVA